MPLAQSEFVIGIATSLLGFASTLISIGINWTREVNAEARRTRLLDRATRQIQFWDSWLKLHLALPHSPEEEFAFHQKVQAELETISKGVEEGLRAYSESILPRALSKVAFDKKIASLGKLRSWFLLYTPKRRLAWLPRVFFYLSILNFFLAIPSYLHQSDLRLTIFALSYYILLAFAFRSLSRWIEQPRPSDNIE